MLISGFCIGALNLWYKIGLLKTPFDANILEPVYFCIYRGRNTQILTKLDLLIVISVKILRVCASQSLPWLAAVSVEGNLTVFLLSDSALSSAVKLEDYNLLSYSYVIHLFPVKWYNLDMSYNRCLNYWLMDWLNGKSW